MEVLGLLLDHGADPTLQVALGLRGTRKKEVGRINWVWVCGEFSEKFGRRVYPATVIFTCLNHKKK